MVSRPRYCIDAANSAHALAISGMNDVLNTQGYTQAAWWNRILPEAWALMMAVGIGSSSLVGYKSHHRRFFGFFALIVSVAFLFIADIDSPRTGMTRVLPQNLVSLSQSLHKH